MDYTRGIWRIPPFGTYLRANRWALERRSVRTTILNLANGCDPVRVHAKEGGRMKNYKFDGNFLYYVRILKKLYEQTLSQAAIECGLSLPEADVLSFLHENPEFDTARDVALYREVSRAYVSKAVELLANRGYIEITQDKDDRRLQHLSITKDANKATEALHRAQFMFYDKVTAGLSDDELFAMLSAIQKCSVNLSNNEGR